mmetsp:Transcript_9122/g.25509  ORF Transcript_9122/g.25509 Transcript_9122/m.25509 type:complete len:262 (-) Transcript_9122:886-1671(-)
MTPRGAAGGSWRPCASARSAESCAPPGRRARAPLPRLSPWPQPPPLPCPAFLQHWCPLATGHQRWRSRAAWQRLYALVRSECCKDRRSVTGRPPGSPGTAAPPARRPRPRRAPGSPPPRPAPRRGPPGPQRPPKRQLACGRCSLSVQTAQSQVVAVAFQIYHRLKKPPVLQMMRQRKHIHGESGPRHPLRLLHLPTRQSPLQPKHSAPLDLASCPRRTSPRCRARTPSPALQPPQLLHHLLGAQPMHLRLVTRNPSAVAAH